MGLWLVVSWLHKAGCQPASPACPYPWHWPQTHPLPFMQLAGLNIRGCLGAESLNLGLGSTTSKGNIMGTTSVSGKGRGREGVSHSQAITCLQAIRRGQGGEYTGVKHSVSSRPTQEAAAIWKSPVYVQLVPTGTRGPVSPSRTPWPGTSLQMS